VPDTPEGSTGLAAALAAEARAEIAAGLAEERAAGIELLIVSEENMPGTMPGCLRQGKLYADAGVRMARTVAAFGPDCTRIGLAIRPLDDWWASVLAFHVVALDRLPTPRAIAALADIDVGWRRVIADIAQACPQVEVVVWDFTAFIGDPAAQLTALAGRPVWLPDQARTRHQNGSPDATALRDRLLAAGERSAASAIAPGPGRWMPFSPAQRAAMQKVYAADLAWLRAGADGCARFVERAATPVRGGKNGKQGRLDATG
jgi:hypothetical protein